MLKRETGEQGVSPGHALPRLRSGEPVFGIIQTIPAPTLTELAVWSGSDFVILDCEHGILDEPAQLACLQVMSGSDAFSAVRVRPGDLAAVGRYLDFGADAILMPDVQSAADAEAFVAAATPGPRGTRSSTGSARATRYGLGRIETGSPLLLALIEGGKAVAAIDAIAATPGLSGLVIGPSDLSADLGCPNDFTAPAYTAAFVRIEQAAASAGLFLGGRAHPGFPIERLLDAGHSFLIAGADITVLRDGFHSQLAAARDRRESSVSAPERK
jgi:2-keto-3-deoxy-L-rhamnonate aldolase RhmA